MILISDGGTITVDCNGGNADLPTTTAEAQTFKILTPIRTTPSRYVPANLAMRCR